LLGLKHPHPGENLRLPQNAIQQRPGTRWIVEAHPPGGPARKREMPVLGPPALEPPEAVETGPIVQVVVAEPFVQRARQVVQMIVWDRLRVARQSEIEAHRVSYCWCD